MFRPWLQAFLALFTLLLSGCAGGIVFESDDRIDSDSSKGLLMLRLIGGDPGTRLEFQEFDRKTRIVGEARFLLPAEKEHKGEYMLARLEPGDYVLRSIQQERRHARFPTQVVNPILPVPADAPQVRIEAGKAYFLGEFLVAFPTDFPRLERVILDPDGLAAARRELAKYPRARVDLLPAAMP